MKQKHFWGWGTLSWGLVLCGCSSTVTPIGGGPGGGSGGVSGSVAQGSSGSSGAPGGGATSGSVAGAGAVDPALAAQLAGTWTGYVENFTFSDQSSALAVTFDTNAVGHASLGDSPTLPPPTDPNVGYPPSLEAIAATEFGQPPEAYPGFALTIQNLSLQESRLQFDLFAVEQWAQWCQLQTPIAAEMDPGVYLCVHDWGVNVQSACFQFEPMTGEHVPIDCGKLKLCKSVCVCTADACSVTSAGTPVHFDLNLNLPRADGSATLDGLHNVHLTKN